MKILEIISGRVPGYRIHLDDINFSVDRGDHVLVDGPPGSGKSKFMRMITGLLEPSEGLVYYKGEPFSYALDQTYAESRRSICYFLRGLEPITDYSVYENLELYFLMNTSRSRENIREEISRRLYLIGLYDKRTENPDYLTNEERTLLSIAMNLKEGGDVYVIDGILTGLKPENQKIAMKMLSGIDFSRATVLVNMQDNHILGLEGNRILRLENGHIAFDGRAQIGTGGL